MSQPNLVEYHRRECEEKQPKMHTSLSFEDFLENALIGTTDVTGGSGNDNNNDNNPHSPAEAPFKNIASFWKQCEGEEGRNEGDSGEKMDITTNALVAAPTARATKILRLQRVRRRFDGTRG